MCVCVCVCVCVADEAKVLESLPTKMKADLAIHVHLDTLSKVSLFKVFSLSLSLSLLIFPHLHRIVRNHY